VAAHVGVETCAVGERLVADEARQRSVTGMRPHVLRQIPRINELLPTDAALMWSLAGVRPDVHLQRERVGKGFPARLARVRLFSGMGPFVYGEMVQLRERPLTHVAAKWALSRVTTYVTFHHFQPEIPLSTHFTDIVPCATIKVDDALPFGSRSRRVI